LPIALDAGETRCTLRLEGDIVIEDSAELKRAMLEAVSYRKDVQLDLASVAEFDLTAMQLLWAAGREAAKQGMNLSITGPESERIMVAIREAGFENLPGQVRATPDSANPDRGENRNDRSV
jgi:ABC-type transporter Mla MlaB component